MISILLIQQHNTNNYIHPERCFLQKQLLSQKKLSLDDNLEDFFFSTNLWQLFNFDDNVRVFTGCFNFAVGSSLLGGEEDCNLLLCQTIFIIIIINITIIIFIIITLCLDQPLSAIEHHLEQTVTMFSSDFDLNNLSS